MPIYRATVRTRTGSRQTLTREAASAREATSLLRADGLAVLAVEETRDAAPGSGIPGLPPAWSPSWLLPMTSIDVEFGFQQLASMLKSGVSLLMGLQTVSEQARRPRAARVWARVAANIQSGRSLSEALSAYRVFEGITIELVRVGEHSGELDLALQRAADQLEAQRNLRMMVANAVFYPIFATTLAVAVTGYLIVGVIPKISEFLQAGGAALPPLTQALVDLSDWLLANGAALLAALGAVVVLVALLRFTKPGRLLSDPVLLRLPVSGRILRLSGTAVFSRAMNMLVESGITLLDALDTAKGLLRNTRLSRRVAEAHGRVMRGESLASALHHAPEFMPMLARMAAVGETTGSLSEAFAEVARFHEQMLAVTIKRFSVLIEPVLIVVTAGVVGFVYIAFFMALFSMAGVS